MPWKWLKDRVSDVADAAWEAATDVADTAWEAATEVADTVVDGVGVAAAATGDVIGAVGATVDAATLGAASGVLDVVDNTVLDTIDTVTGGLVDVDFDDGNLSAGVGLDGIAHVGANVGEDGLGHSADLLDQKYDLRADEDGLSASSQAGIDWGPLPYAESDLSVGADGDITFDGRAQGTLPTPWGLASGRAEAHVVRNAEMWGASLDADGSLRRPDGSIITAGVDAAYVETADGSALSLGVEGSYTVPGTGTVGGSLGYDRIETDGMVAERFEGDAYASGYGVQVDAGVEYTSVTDADGTTSTWDVTGDLSGFGSQPAPAVAVAPVADPSPAPIVEPALAPAPQPAVAAIVVPEASPIAEPSFHAEPAPASETPSSDFETAIAAADEVQTDVDEMFAELG